MTNSLERRIWQHKTKAIEGFTKQFGLGCLVHYEQFRNVNQAIAREKEIKGRVRKRKLALIETDNPAWSDLSAAWLETLWILRCAQNDTRRAVIIALVILSAAKNPANRFPLRQVVEYESPLTRAPLCLIKAHLTR